MGLKEIKAKASLNMSKGNISSAIRNCDSSSRNLNSAYNGAFNGTKLKDVEIALSSINRINKGRNQKLADMKSLAERISNSID